MKFLLIVLLAPVSLFSQSRSAGDLQRWQAMAQHVTIIRDNWGIPHVYGKTDADAVFGLLYAQCEDDFARVEMNYIEKLGRLSEVNGRRDLYNDLLIRLVIDSAAAISDYRHSPAWLHRLLDAFADGVNYYLYTHPNIHPALLRRFEPWYPLLWTDGSIGAINTAGVSAEELRHCYGGSDSGMGYANKPTAINDAGSNGFAVGPSKTASGNAILYINPHVTYYFRPEVQMVSEEGLNVYGAVTWGQFFVYQGFNEHCGWMHTSNQVDVADLYAERITERDGRRYYQYEGHEKALGQRRIPLYYRENDSVGFTTLTTFFTGHGPIMARRNGQWLSLRAVNRSMNGLIQSWLRTKATSFAGFKKVMGLRGNMSNNTVYADAERNIAYWHGNFIPVRDTALNWNKPVDGTVAATEWRGLHAIDETIHLYNPSGGWLQNCNSTPFTAAGAASPRRSQFPAYMAGEGENFRSVNAVRLLSAGNAYTLDKMIATGYDTYMSAFDVLLPPLLKAFAQTTTSDTSELTAIETLRRWNRRSSDTSVATTLAVYWGERIANVIYANIDADAPFDQVEATRYFADTASAKGLLSSFRETLMYLTQRFGRWSVPWGEINRFQRLSAYPAERFSDTAASLAVGRVSSQWGMIPAFESYPVQGSSKRYGTGGNSFICVVEFGKRVSARSLLSGGESGHAASPHFNDQAAMFARGEFKEVLFYRDDVLKHAEQNYHPGQLRTAP